MPTRRSGGHLYANRIGNRFKRHGQRNAKIDLGKLFRNKEVVKIPIGDENTIVFPFNFSTCEFDKQHYFPIMTNNILGTEELNKFLAEIERQVQVWYAYSESGVLWMKCLFFILLLVLTATLIAIPFVVKASSSKSSSSFPIIIPLGILVGYVIFFIIMTIIIKSRSKRKLTEVTENVNIYINQKRGNFFKSRGLEWIVPLRFPHWIELCRKDAGRKYNPMNQELQVETVEMNSYSMSNNMRYKIHPEIVMSNQTPLQQKDNLGFYSQNM